MRKWRSMLPPDGLLEDLAVPRKELHQGCSQMSPPIPVNAYGFLGVQGRKKMNLNLGRAVQIPELLAYWHLEYQVSGFSSLDAVSNLSSIYSCEVVSLERMQFYTIWSSCGLKKGNIPHPFLFFQVTFFFFQSKQHMASRVVTSLLLCRSGSGNIRWEWEACSSFPVSENLKL